MRLVRSLSAVLLLAVALAVPSAQASGGGGTEDVHFAGLITSLPASGLLGAWTVGGKTVHVSAATKIQAEAGPVAVGATANVEGTPRSDGSIDAKEIEVQGSDPADPGGDDVAELHGLVETLPAGGLIGDWAISGRAVQVSATTQVVQEHGRAAVGALVEVKGNPRGDGSLDASRIEVQSSPVPGTDGAPGAAEVKGIVEALASSPGFVGAWTVHGTTVHVTEVTRIDQESGVLAVGSLVEVKGTQRPDGSVDARRVEVLLGDADGATALGNVSYLTSVARSQGLGGSFYTTDLTISNGAAMEARVEVLFTGHERDGRGGPRASFRVGAGETVTFDDALASLFGLGSDWGAIRLSSNLSTLLVSSVTSTPGGGGSYGLGHEAVERNELVTEERRRSIAGIRSDDGFRTNLSLTNATERALDVDLTLLAASGEPLGVTRVHLEPLEMRQLNDAPRSLGAPAGIAGGRFLLGTATPDGAFAASATLIDNRTNDPRLLSAR